MTPNPPPPGYPAPPPVAPPSTKGRNTTLLWALLASSLFFCCLVPGGCVAYLQSLPETGVLAANELSQEHLAHIRAHVTLGEGEEVVTYSDATMSGDGTTAALLTTKRLLTWSPEVKAELPLDEIKQIDHSNAPLEGDVIDVTSNSGKLVRVEVAPLNNGERFVAALERTAGLQAKHHLLVDKGKRYRVKTRPVIAIVGRPNVGKSTLFNRLVGRRLAIVEDTPGVTRDRHFADTEYEDRPVTFVDTGGFVPDHDEDVLAKHIRLQAQAAIEEADVVLFVVDGRTGASAADQDVARALRKANRPVVLIVNKVDGRRDQVLLTADFHSLALGEPVPVSAEHNIGFTDLADRLTALLPPPPPQLPEEDDEGQGAPADEEAPKLPKGPTKDTPIRVALVGRPNVGKSTLVNALLGEERVIVSPIAGTTRDPIDTALEYGGRQVVLTDTAGIRRKSVISQKIEEFSVFGAIRAIEDSDVAVLVLDATEAGVEQDQKIAAIAQDKGRALLIVVNKWDLARHEAKENQYRDSLKWYMKFVSWAPMVFVSAKDGHKVSKVLDLALQLYDMQHFRAGTPMLNRIIEHVTTEHPLPVVKGRPLKLYYAMQVATAPPSFAFICNQPKDVPERYERYVSNYLRETFNLKVPIRMFWRERPGQKQRAAQAQRFKNRSESIRQAKNRRKKR